jgi:allantoinase
VLVVRSRNVVLPEGLQPASVHIADGRIVRVLAHDETAEAREVADFGELVVSPGIVDTHVHINEPGRAEWEGFDTATRAAAAGGVTTLVDMPLNSVPPTTSVEGLEAKRRAAGRTCHVDVSFWGGVVPENASEIDALIDAGVCGFKCFLVPSGVDEFPAVDEAVLRRVMPILARRNVPLLVHAEAPGLIRAFDASGASDPSLYESYLSTRPAEAEIEAVRMMIRLAEEFAVLTHIVHVAASGVVDELANAQAAGVPITAETCPHYLTFAAIDVPDGATEFKCAPPIREEPHREALWSGLGRGVLGLVATDHSPSPPDLKTPGDFVRAWGGIASLELSLPAVWTGAAARGFSVADVARWTSAAPAALAGLTDRKGAVAPGRDADLVVWDPDAEFVVDPCSLQQRHKLTPYAGRRLRGMVRKTFLRGAIVWDGERPAPAPLGRLL